MKIYDLFYEDTGLYNRSIFILPNDEAAKKAMKLSLLDPNPKADGFRTEAKLGHTILVALGHFSEENGLEKNPELEKICNLKDLIDDNNGNLAETKPDNA